VSALFDVLAIGVVVLVLALLITWLERRSK